MVQATHVLLSNKNIAAREHQVGEEHCSHQRWRLPQTYRGEDLPGLHQVPLLCKHCCNSIGSIDVVLVLPQNSIEVLQGFEEAVMDLLQGLCSFGVPPAPGIAPLGCVLVHMELASLEVEYSFQ